MLDEDYTTPEGIFTVPHDITELDKYDAIGHLLERIKGTVLTSCHLVESDGELSRQSLGNCLYGVYGQLEILEKLVQHKTDTEKIIFSAGGKS